jgi:hypothetical protein
MLYLTINTTKYLRFCDRYGVIHNHRTLKWINTLGEAVVTAQYGQKSYDLQVSTLQVRTAVLSVCSKKGAYE